MPFREFHYLVIGAKLVALLKRIRKTWQYYKYFHIQNSCVCVPSAKP